MKALFANLGVLSSTLLPSHILPREEGHVWTTPQDSVDGAFIFPRTYPLTLREGSNINISWSMKYENINLYFYQRGKVANSVQLVTNLASEWYQWEVGAEERNLTNPFVFRIVNAQGTTDEQKNGGFWSTSWYLTRDDNAIESAISTSSSVSLTTATSSATSLPSTTSLASATSSEIPLSTRQESKSEATVIPPTAPVTQDKGVGKGTIIGLTVGLVVAGAIIIAGLLYYMRKRKASKDASSLASLPAPSYYEKTQVQKEQGLYTVHEVFAQPSELHSGPLCYELPSQRV